MKKLYSIDIQKLGLLLLPTRLRQPLLMAWFRAVSSPLQSLHVGFTRYRDDVAYKLSHNGQVCYLTKALNDALDSQQRRIVIREVFRAEAVIFFPEKDNKPVAFDDTAGVVFYPQALIESNIADFEVVVPSDVFTVASKTYQRSESEVKARNIIGAYKLASKRYNLTNQ